MNRFNHLSLQRKIVVVLLLVISPVFLLVSLLQNQIAKPTLEAELKQIGLALASSLANEIAEQNLLYSEEKIQHLERRLKHVQYLEPSIVRIDVLKKTASGTDVVASTDRDADRDPPSDAAPLSDRLSSDQTVTQTGIPVWEIFFPVRRQLKGADSAASKATVRLLISLKGVHRFLGSLWRNSAIAAVVTIALLILVFNFFLRKTIENEKALQISQRTNARLSDHIRQLEQDLITKDKLAAMGQLTAQFAHEVGSPLTAVSAHLQLLDRDLSRFVTGADTAPTEKAKWLQKVKTIGQEIGRIEGIIHSFLERSPKRSPQSQLVEINAIVSQAVAIIESKAREFGIEVQRRPNAGHALTRLVPIEMEQVLVNLFNNSIDALNQKGQSGNGAGIKRLEIDTEVGSENSIVITVRDNGAGIPSQIQPQLFQPFFTTKGVGQGTGLGLTICRDLVEKNGGTLKIDSVEGEWTKATMVFPLEGNA